MKCHPTIYGILRNCEGVPEELHAKFIHYAHGKSQVVTTNQQWQDKYWWPELDMKDWSLILKSLTKIKTSVSCSTITTHLLIFFFLCEHPFWAVTLPIQLSFCDRWHHKMTKQSIDIVGHLPLQSLCLPFSAKIESCENWYHLNSYNSFLRIHVKSHHQITLKLMKN